MIKKSYLITILSALACVLLTAATVSLAKYVNSLDSSDSPVTAPTFFFNSNVLSGSHSVDTAPVKTVNGKSTEVTLTNGAGSDEFSSLKIDYTVKYSVYTDSGWREAKVENYSFDVGGYHEKTLTVKPTLYGGITYDKVLVEATSSAPYVKTLVGVFEFEYSGYAWSADYADGVITLRVHTNYDSGSFAFAWTDGITPDNSDPNLIFSGVTSSMRSLTASLKEKTSYEFKFFVTGSSLRSELDGGTKTPESIVTVTK